jgi:hypothetical protein
MEVNNMRRLSFFAAAVVACLSSAVYAQAWSEYINRQEFFTVNFPGDPAVKEIPYKTEKGTNLKAKVFTANAPAGSITAGRYAMTVVDYSSAPGELSTAVAEAAKIYRAKGNPTYDDTGNVDRIRTQRQTIETSNMTYIMTEILAHGTRLYIVEAETAMNVPPPAQFQASVQILDENGQRIRYENDGKTRVRPNQ